MESESGGGLRWGEGGGKFRVGVQRVIQEWGGGGLGVRIPQPPERRTKMNACCFSAQHCITIKLWDEVNH